MMRDKTTIATLLLALMFSLVLAACGSQPAASPAQSGEAPKAAAPAAAPAKEMTALKFAVGTQVVSPLFANFIVPDYMGYFEEEGIEFSIHPLGAAVTVQQGLANRSYDVGVVVPGVMFPPIAKGEPMPVTAFYNYTPRFKYELLVADGSPIADGKELKGKIIGVESLGSSTFPVGKAMIKSLGIDPDTEVEWVAAPAGAPAGVALEKGDVDAYISYDTLSANLVSLGFKFKGLPFTVPPDLAGIAGFYVGAHNDWLKANPELAAGFSRAVAKGTVFALNNPDAAARMFFNKAPEAMPKGKTVDEAAADIVLAVEARAKNWRRDEPHPWGQIVKDELMADVRFLELQDQITDADVESIFTNQFIDEANKFDAAAIEAAAKNFKMN